MTKLIYICGLASFFASFFSAITPQKMTSSEGEEVELWMSPVATHLSLALEPFSQTFGYFSGNPYPESHGDGFEATRRENLRRSFYSFPASCGWFGIVLSVVIMPLTWIRPVTNAKLRLGLQAAGAVIVGAVPLLALDFYRDATVYRGHFHLGLGAYLIVASYLLIGISLLLQFAPARPSDTTTTALVD